jgi:hypothetical protein
MRRDWLRQAVSSVKYQVKYLAALKLLFYGHFDRLKYVFTAQQSPIFTAAGICRQRCHALIR